MPPPSSIARLSRPSICSSCRHALRQRHASAALSSTTRPAAPRQPRQPESAKPAQPAQPAAPTNVFSELRQMADNIGLSSTRTQPNQNARQGTTDMMKNIIAGQDRVAGASVEEATERADLRREPHHMHVYAHKHNTHITLTRPNREPIMSLSSGNIGFKKGQRGSFDAGFQLAAYFIRAMQDRGILTQARQNQWAEQSDTFGRRMEAPIQTLEVVLRGFGKGRDAVTRALLGAEGRLLRTKILSVSDDTKLKFGGTRSPGPRRL